MSVKKFLPSEVRTPMSLLLVAIGAGVVETLLFLTQAVSSGSVGDIAIQAGVRILIYTALALLVLQLRKGGNGMRIVVALLIGGFGTLSMVASPIAWLAAGNSPFEFLAQADGWTLAFTGLRVLHVIAVLSAMVWLFRPAANAFFAKQVAAA